MHSLSLDIGKRHTGVAYANSEVGIALPLDTMHHKDDEGLIDAVALLVEKRNIETLVIGLPLFMSGEESEQTRYVQDVSERINEACPQCTIEFIDERGTSNVAPLQKSQDPHAQAATILLSVFLERKA